MFEQKPKPKPQPGQKPSAAQKTGLAKPGAGPSRPLAPRPPLRTAVKSVAGAAAGAGTSAAKKPAATPTLRHAVYRPPAQGAQAPKPPVSDPMRARIGVFKDKETRQALYSVYAVIQAARAVNPKQAQEALKVFQQQTLKDKGLTAEEARTLARVLSVGFGAQAGAQGAVLDGGDPDMTGKAYQQQVLAGYNALTGNKKNTAVPGVGAFFDPKMPPLSPMQQAIFGLMAGAGPGLAGIGGKLAAGAVGSVLGKNSIKTPQTTTTTAQPSLPLPQRGTPARPASQTGTRAQYERAQQEARLARYRYDPKLRKDAQLVQDLKPAPRTGETPQQAQQRVQAAQREIQTRKVMDVLGNRPWRPNIAANDVKNAGQGAHTLDRHGWNLTDQDLKDRVMGTGRWTRQESYSYRWVSEEVANREVQKYIRYNWDKIRRSLAETGRFSVFWDTGTQTGEGYYNKNVTLGGPRIPMRSETSWADMTIELNSAGQPFIVTAYPKGGFK